MNWRLPSLRGEEVIRALKRAGFAVVRIKGSHHIVEHIREPRRRTTVPVHQGKDLKRGLLRKILDDVELTEDELRAFL